MQRYTVAPLRVFGELLIGAFERCRMVTKYRLEDHANASLLRFVDLLVNGFCLGGTAR